MAESVLDFAGLDAQATAAENTTPEVNSETTEVETTETPTVETTTEVGNETTDSGKEGAEGKTEVAAGDKTEATKEELPGTESTPQEVRKALKAFKDADPKNSAMVKQLHGAFERHEAYKAEFPTVQEAREAKQFIENIGGYEGFEQLQNTLKSVEESDHLLYSGDAKLLDNIYEDMKSEGKQDAFGKLASPFLDKLKDVDKKAYYATLTPHYVESLERAKLPDVIAALTNLAEVGDEKSVAEIKAIVADMGDWFGKLKGEAAKAKQAPTPEQLALKADREKFEKEQQEFKTNQTKEFQSAVGKEAETTSNNMLGKHLTPFLKSAYFKGFSRENLRPLAAEIQRNLRDELSSDKAYQTQMKALWGAKTPDKGKILQYHKTKVETMADRIVRSAVQRMYPDHAKGGSAAGRIAAANQKKEQTQKQDAVAVASGKPVYVAVKPKNLNRDMDPQSLLEIAGKGYIPDGKGKWKLVTWRR
jgi:hypothetical protein